MTTKIFAPAFGAFLVLLCGGAQAQTCTGGPFDGPYIGANLGYGHSRASQSAPPAANEPEISGSDNAFTVGGQVGYNRQCGHVVLGVEADFNYVGFATSTSWPDPVLPVFLKDKVDWFGTVRGRVGVTVHNGALVYATGGLAYADTSHTLDTPALPFHQTDHDFKTGWTVGGGIELVHDVRWLLRAEALYVDLGSNTHTYTFTGCGGPCTARATWDDSFWVARLGLSYKFGVREPVPLK
jgi:outer membrane immunogenic protein